MKEWIINQPSDEEVKNLSRSAGISEFAAKLLINRGIKDRQQADEFFNCDELSDPDEIADIDKAAAVIQRAIDRGEKITVYGDYDCDGVTAVAILYGYLEAMGAEADWYIPSRDEGYGLNVNAIDRLAKNGTKLIVTVDNGISAESEADYIYEIGLKLVVTDHHQVPPILPKAEAVVNPHRAEDNSRCKELAGCGVALKLVMALEGDTESVLQNWGDLAAIGTVGDIVPLTGENRVLVKRGLENINLTANGGLKALLMQCGVQDDCEVTAATAAFAICPRINAAGRFAHAKEAAELFLCDNPKMYNTMAEKLTLLNQMRQDEEKRITEQTDEMIRENPRILKERVIVLNGLGWSHGVIGIVASKLMNRYSKPVIMITREGLYSRGSARSIEGFSLYEMFTELSDMLIKFGGHEKAAGFTVETDDIDEFAKAVNAYARKKFPKMPHEKLTAEMTLSAAELTMENIESLNYFRPFGEGNPAPVFHIRDAVIKNLRPLKEGKYLSFTADVQGTEFKVVNFRSSYNDFPYAAGDKVDIMVNAEINEYGGQRSINLKLADIRHADFSQDRFFAAMSTYESLCLGEDIDPRLGKRIVPDRSVLTVVYQVIRHNGSISACAALAGRKGVNYCLFRVSLDAFESVGLLKTNFPADTLELQKTNTKVELVNCEFLTRLRRKFGI